MLQTRMRVTQHYCALRFDVVTCVPVSIIENFAIRVNCGPDGNFVDDAPLDLGWLKIFKPLRVAKLARLIKTVPGIFRLIEALEKFMRVPVFLSRLFRLLFAISFTVHTVACLFWLVKEAFAASPEDIAAFQEQAGLNPDAGLLDKYMLAAYYITTVFTTVGFGDISAENTPERIFTIGAMYLGVIVFGMLLSEVQNAISDLYEYQRQVVCCPSP